jgi:eukaryotic-like serine/threonine-protein kinase
MPLRSGTRLGPYEVVALLGAGGMGEVYRARDIGHVYGLEDTPAADRRHGEPPLALVLELVEGATLADRIARVPAGRTGTSSARRRREQSGAEADRETNRNGQASGRGRSPTPRDAGLPIDEALAIAFQIAGALEAAHEQGIVHRDLKPANIKIRPDGVVKVLDFGLARAFDLEPASAAEAMNTPTATGPGGITGAGVILGTAPYMSPEQARGRIVDKRTDIWAFGCVLFEMLTGRQTFDGETSSDTTVAILTHDPEWAALPPATPAGVRGLLQRCLEKDSKRRLRDIGEARIELERLTSEAAKRTVGPRHRSASRWTAVAAGLVLLLAGIVAVVSFWRSRPPGPLHYTQLTDFSDSATAANLSPNGQMMTFIRGGPYFQSPRQIGQIYVKLLPDGEAVRLTNDSLPKFAPVFTPDGSRVAYSVVNRGSWDTWTVPVLGGQPTRILPNATGLTWIGPGRVLFSEIKSGQHMGIVTATEVRAESREIYFPEHERAMAHYSYVSPDHKSILIVEMGPGGGFGQRCRLVPFDGSSRGRLVGPEGPCRSAAWSPDGRWMYFGAVVNERSHLWRQSFPDGTPQQITFDPTDEEGIAVASDGKSLVTSVGNERHSVWIHDDDGERQLTSEGSARIPRLSADGRYVFYLQGETLFSSDLRRVELATGKSEQVLPGWSMGTYDISPDGLEVVFASRGRSGELEIWLASLDRGYSPRQITRGGDQPSFGPNGTVILRQQDRNANYLYRINKDGSGGERILSRPILSKSSVSPDGEWVIVNRAMTAEDAGTSGGIRIATVALSLRGGAATRMCAFNCMPNWSWSPDGKLVYASTPQGRTMILPVAPNRSLPDVPESGIPSTAEAIKVPGARFIEQVATPGPTPSTYLFVKTEIRRNLFRLELR